MQQQYFKTTYRKNLDYPGLPCVEVCFSCLFKRMEFSHSNTQVGAGALIPLELCRVPPGQLMKKAVPPEKTRDVLAFSTQKPSARYVQLLTAFNSYLSELVARLQSIKNGIRVFEYETSEYLRSFGMSVNTSGGPLSVPARILEPPNLKYGRGSRQPNIVRI